MHPQLGSTQGLIQEEETWTGLEEERPLLSRGLLIKRYSKNQEIAVKITIANIYLTISLHPSRQKRDMAITPNQDFWSRFALLLSNSQLKQYFILYRTQYVGQMMLRMGFSSRLLMFISSHVGTNKITEPNWLKIGTGRALE